MEITEKVAYLKGLMEGMKIDTETNEGKILSAMVDILEDIGLELEDLWNAQGELEDGLDVVSDDLEDIEDIVYDEDDEDDEESFDDEYYEDDAEEDEDCYATTCPTCEETIYFDESVLEDGEVICPNCGEKLEFDMSSLEEDSDDDQE
ncbi:CD1247 N-terminal domain-containing protein [Dysosmobacter sp.]|uniref:CD1247 N-terminal domain-containing protein n=1 Tax=Dysosmobacter sp. TaxID=2591382 RepID=UPI003AB4FF76